MARGSLRSILGLVNQESRRAPHEEFLRDLIYTMEWQDPNDTRKPSLTYKPSSMECIRNMYYQRSGADMDPGGAGIDYEGQGMGESGTDRHNRLQGWICRMKERGIDCEYYDVETYLKMKGITNVMVRSKNGMETKCFHTDLNMSFMTDGIIRYKGEWYVLEIKTEISMKWYKRSDAEESHKRQAACYCHAFGLNKVIFLYENRDMLTLKSYLVEIPKEKIQVEVVDRIADCEGYVQRMIVPPKPEGVNCRWCPYQERCRRDGK